MESAHKIGVLIATPMRSWQGIVSLHTKMQAELARLSEMSMSKDCPYEFGFAVVEGGLARGRNRIVHDFLRGSFKWLVWWDDDIEATADDVIRMVTHKQPFVAGLYTTREDNPHYVATFMHEVELQKGCLLQVIEAGTGFQCVHRQVFEELARIYPQLEYSDRDTGERVHAFFQQVAMTTDLRPDGDFLSEDYFFCHLCRHAKIGMFVDVTVKVNHRGKDGTLYPKEWPPVPLQHSVDEEGYRHAVCDESLADKRTIRTPVNTP